MAFACRGLASRILVQQLRISAKPHQLFLLQTVSRKASKTFLKTSTVFCFPCLHSSTQPCRSETVSMDTDDARSLKIKAEEEARETVNSFDPELTKKLKVIKLEYEVMLHMSDKVAENITDVMWLQLLECETKSARRRLHVYFRKNENFALAREKKKAVRREESKQKQEALETGEEEKEELNTFMLKLRKKTMLRYYNSRLANAMMYGFPLLVDLGFEEFMKPREMINLSEQLMLSHGFNKVHKEPFHLIFCNAEKDSKIVKNMQKQSGLLPLEDYMFTITEQSYLDLYPKDQLVYLTPNAPEFMTKYDNDKVYILGGFVDKSNPKPLTMAKAKRQGIRMEKLPLDYFHKWEKGTKSLTLDQMIKILLDIQFTQDWPTAFKHLPSRKLVKEAPVFGQKH